MNYTQVQGLKSYFFSKSDNNVAQGNITPATTNTYDLGSGTKLWDNIFLSTLYINDSANGNQGKGITITTPTTIADEAITLKGADVAHGITTLTETDTYAWLGINTAADGGLKIRGFTEITEGVNIFSITTTAVTTKGTSAAAPISLGASLKSGTTHGSLGADANILKINSFGSVKFIFDSDGDMWYTGNLQPYRNSATYTGYVFVPLITPYTNTSWDGNDNKTTGTYNIDLSADFNSALVGVKAVLIRLDSQWTTTADANYIAARPYGGSVDAIKLIGQNNGRHISTTAIVPTDATNFDIDIVVAGATAENVTLEIWGYFI